MGFNSFKEVAQLFDFNIYDLLDKIFSTKQIQDTMILFNQDQLQKGLDALNQKIHTFGGNPYRPYTIIIRQEAFLPVDRVTLEFSGRFYKTFFVRIVQNGYEIIANFQKPDGDIRDNLPSQFDVLGLTDDSAMQLINNYVFPLLTKMIRERLRI